MKNTLILSFLLIFSINLSATKCTHTDDYEVRYIAEDMQLDNQIQENLRNQMLGKSLFQFTQTGLHILMSIIINHIELLVLQLILGKDLH